MAESDFFDRPPTYIPFSSVSPFINVRAVQLGSSRSVTQMGGAVQLRYVSELVKVASHHCRFPSSPLHAHKASLFLGGTEKGSTIMSSQVQVENCHLFFGTI